MWDTPEPNPVHMSRELPCATCGHNIHTYLPCSDTCDCPPCVIPGTPA